MKVACIEKGEAYHKKVSSEAETNQIAGEFARRLQSGDVVALEGDLGAGKTVVARAIATALGFPGPVTSPSFTLLNVYEWNGHKIYHFDFYRIHSEFEAAQIGTEEFLDGDGISLIEWPERIRGLLPARYYRFRIAIPDYTRDPDAREIIIEQANL